MGFEAEGIAFEWGKGVRARKARGRKDLAFGEEDGDGEACGAERQGASNDADFPAAGDVAEGALEAVEDAAFAVALSGGDGFTNEEGAALSVIVGACGVEPSAEGSDRFVGDEGEACAAGQGRGVVNGLPFAGEIEEGTEVGGEDEGGGAGEPAGFGGGLGAAINEIGEIFGAAQIAGSDERGAPDQHAEPEVFPEFGALKRGVLHSGRGARSMRSGAETPRRSRAERRAVRATWQTATRRDEVVGSAGSMTRQLS